MREREREGWTGEKGKGGRGEDGERRGEGGTGQERWRQKEREREKERDEQLIRCDRRELGARVDFEPADFCLMIDVSSRPPPD